METGKSKISFINALVSSMFVIVFFIVLLIAIILSGSSGNETLSMGFIMSLVLFIILIIPTSLNWLGYIKKDEKLLFINFIANVVGFVVILGLGFWLKIFFELAPILLVTSILGIFGYKNQKKLNKIDINTEEEM